MEQVCDTPIAQELYYRRIHRRIIGLWRHKEGERVLDVGCGTGVLLRELAKTFAGLSLTGLDLSEDMLGVARRPLADAKSPAPEFHGGSVYEMPFRDGSFDVVLNTISCHFCTEQVCAFREIQRVTAPGGRFYCPALTSLVAPLVVPGVGVWYPKRTLRRHLEQAGFRVERAERVMPNAVLAHSWRCVGAVRRHAGMGLQIAYLRVERITTDGRISAASYGNPWYQPQKSEYVDRSLYVPRRATCTAKNSERRARRSWFVTRQRPYGGRGESSPFA